MIASDQSRIVPVESERSKNPKKSNDDRLVATWICVAGQKYPKIPRLVHWFQKPRISRRPETEGDVPLGGNCTFSAVQLHGHRRLKDSSKERLLSNSSKEGDG